MGRLKKKFSDISYVALDLNEGNVQEIFNRCLRKENSRDITRTMLFPTKLGYAPEDELVLEFDKNLLLKNKMNIEYLYGQLNSVHTGKFKKERMSMEDFTTTYKGDIWSQSKASLLELLYLGCNNAVAISYPFSKNANDTTAIREDIKPTFSPKDPNFSAWWEEHKSEWETPKKEGQEPADD